MENLDEILQNAEELMETARAHRKRRGGPDHSYVELIAIQAVYKQNEAIIELLKNYQKQD